MAVIFWLSSQPLLPAVSLLPAWLSHDWLHHGLAFGGLAVLLLRALADADPRQVRPALLALAWMGATAYGVTDEWHQWFVPGRTPDLRDIVADGSGAALALGAAWAWSIIKRPS